MNEVNALQEYYIRHDGTADQLAALLNCLQAGLYFKLKNNYGITNPYELFVKDTAFCIDFHQDGSFRDVNNPTLWGCHEVFKTEDIKGKGRAALSEMELLLDQGELLIFETHIARLPFFEGFVSFDAFFDEDAHLNPPMPPQNHLLLAVGHTDQHLIYVEMPHLLTSRHIPYANRKDVGIIEKDVLMHAADCFLDYRRIHIREEGLANENLIARVEKALKSTLAQSQMPPRVSPHYTRYYGNEGLDQFIEVCDSGDFQSGERSILHPSLHEGEVLLWKFRNLKQQLGILYHCVQRNEEHFGQYGGFLLQALHAYNNNVEILISKLRMMQIRRNYHTNGLADVFRKIKESNTRLLEEIARWSSLYEIH
jgi:hypothetical protein